MNSPADLRVLLALAVQTGRDRFVPTQRILPTEEAEAVMTAFWRRYPQGVRFIL